MHAGDDESGASNDTAAHSYPDPQPAKSICTKDREKKAAGDNCPHAEGNLSLWEDPETWGGQVPDPRSWVTLPEETKVLITSCSVSEEDLYTVIEVPETSQVQSQSSPKLKIVLMVKSSDAHGH